MEFNITEQFVRQQGRNLEGVLRAIDRQEAWIAFYEGGERKLVLAPDRGRARALAGEPYQCQLQLVTGVRRASQLRWVYTADIWGSEPFTTPGEEGFQARVDSLYKEAGWGRAPEVYESGDGTIWAEYRDRYGEVKGTQEVGVVEWLPELY